MKAEISRQFLNQIPVRIILPVVMTVILFVMMIFFLIIPLVESGLMDGKRETIRELTETAWGVLQAQWENETAGALTRDQAQKAAIDILAHLRYGPELKDYFWINDMRPYLIMHPYRPDLNGRDISDFTDPKGKRLFVECVKTVRASGAGYVDYEWQWKDDPQRIVPKISYVKGFTPWDWIIGTGIYVEDVRAEIAAIIRKLTLACAVILAFIMVLMSYIIIYGAQVEKEKAAAEEKARMRQEQLFQAAKMVSLGTLVSGVAHEINNPITSVMLNTPTLQKVWDAALPILDVHAQDAPDFQMGGINYHLIRQRIPALLADIADGARRVKDIVGDLKDFARESTSGQKDAVDINMVAQKAVGLVANLVKKSTDCFSADYTMNLPLFKGNARRIEQVIINLIMNACQALPDSSRAVEVTTGHITETGRVFIRIRDEGAGISPDVLQRIKDPFFTTRRESGGTGLGLAISERIIADHDGEMVFDSQPGKGTTVEISFPAQPNKQENSQ